jgi:hypothetical protein
VEGAGKTPGHRSDQGVVTESVSPAAASYPAARAGQGHQDALRKSGAKHRGVAARGRCAPPWTDPGQQKVAPSHRVTQHPGQGPESRRRHDPRIHPMDERPHRLDRRSPGQRILVRPARSGTAAGRALPPPGRRRAGRGLRPGTRGRRSTPGQAARLTGHGRGSPAAAPPVTPGPPYRPGLPQGSGSRRSSGECCHRTNDRGRCKQDRRGTAPRK